MKKLTILALAAAATIILTACDDGDDYDIVIRNHSDFPLVNARIDYFRIASFGTINPGGNVFYNLPRVGGGNITIRPPSRTTGLATGETALLTFQLVTAHGTINATVIIPMPGTTTITNDTIIQITNPTSFVPRLPSQGELKAIFDELDSRITFTMRNESGQNITNVMWNNIDFGNAVSQPGSVAGRAVSSGTGHIFFTVGGINTRTSAVIITERGNPLEFIFSNSTMVVNLTTNETTTLGNL